ncbi:MAG: hypothetical protein ACLVC1_00330 [Mediterraneibacter gnavus]
MVEKEKYTDSVIATLIIMAFLTYTLGLLDVDANTRKNCNRFDF